MRIHITSTPVHFSDPLPEIPNCPEQMTGKAFEVPHSPAMFNTVIKGCTWILIAMMTTSCCTDALWSARSPESNMTEVHYYEMTECALIEDGFIYTKDDDKELFFIQTSQSKNGYDLTKRIAATPIALAADGLIWATFGILNLGAAMGGASDFILPPLNENEAANFFAQ